MVTPTVEYVTGGKKAHEQYARNPIMGSYPQAREWRLDDDRWVRARSARGAREGSRIQGPVPTREDKVDTWADAPVRRRIETPSARASRQQNMWDLLGPSYEAPPAAGRSRDDADRAGSAGPSEGAGKWRPISAAPAYREPKPPPPAPPPPKKPAQNIITNHLPDGVAPRSTTSTLERPLPPGGLPTSPHKPSIKELAATREAAASAKEARVRAFDLKRIDKPGGPHIFGSCIPTEAAPSTWIETTSLQNNRDVSYRGRNHDVEAFNQRRRDREFTRDAARVNNRFARTAHIRNGESLRRGFNILTGEVEERRSTLRMAEVPQATPGA